MKQLKVLILISCLLSALNCKSSPPLKFQKNGQNQAYLIVTGSKNSTVHTEGVDISEEHFDYHNMTEETFMNVLNADLDTLSLIEGIWSNEKNTYKIGIKKAEKKDTYVAFILNSRDPSVNKGEIIADFIETRYKYIYFTKYYLEDKTEILTKANIDEYGMLLIFLEKWGKEDLAFFRNSLVKETTEEERKVSNSKQSLIKEGEKGNDEYYVQVGSSRNHNYAKKMLVKIKKYYPHAYIVEHNNYSKIRIPGVLTKKQGASVSKDIEKKFNLKPMVVLKKQ